MTTNNPRSIDAVHLSASIRDVIDRELPNRELPAYTRRQLRKNPLLGLKRHPDAEDDQPRLILGVSAVDVTSISGSREEMLNAGEQWAEPVINHAIDRGMQTAEVGVTATFPDESQSNHTWQVRIDEVSRGTFKVTVLSYGHTLDSPEPPPAIPTVPRTITIGPPVTQPKNLYVVEVETIDYSTDDQDYNDTVLVELDPNTQEDLLKDLLRILAEMSQADSTMAFDSKYSHVLGFDLWTEGAYLRGNPTGYDDLTNHPDRGFDLDQHIEKYGEEEVRRVCALILGANVQFVWPTGGAGIEQNLVDYQVFYYDDQGVEHHVTVD